MTDSERKKNLSEPVDISGVADEFIEAALPVPSAHREGETDRALALLKSNPDVARTNIWTACMAGELETVRRMLSDDSQLAKACGGTRNWDPLLYLSFSRFLRTDSERARRMVQIAALLLENGADVNTHWIDPNEGEGNRETPLYGAAGVANNPALTKVLMDAGADPDDGETAYHMVEHDGVPCAELVFPKFDELNRGIALAHKVDYEDVAGLRKLLDLGADPNAPTMFVNLPAHQAVWRGRSKEFFDVLFEFGADFNLPNKEGKTPYALAARSGRTEIMEWLLDSGASVEMNEVDVFIAACAAGDEKRARQLLQEKPDLKESFAARDNAEICEAACAGNTEGVRTMLALGWDVNAPGVVWKEGPIHRAAIKGHLDMVKLLVESGADLTMRDRSYRASPVGWADHGEQKPVLDYLRRHGDKLGIRDAAELGVTDRVFVLLADGDANAAFEGGDAGVLLRAAVASGAKDLVSGLLKRGADPSIRNSHGYDSFDVARVMKRPEMISLLEGSR